MPPLLRGKRALAPDLPFAQGIQIVRLVLPGEMPPDCWTEAGVHQLSRAAFIMFAQTFLPERAGLAVSALRPILPIHAAGAADEYGSGLTLDRPALQKVTKAVVAGRVDVVLVHSLTRIGREWGMAQSYIDLLTRHKVKLLCIRDRLLFNEKGATSILTIKNAECPL